MEKKTISIEELLRRQKEVEVKGIESKFGGDAFMFNCMGKVGQQIGIISNIDDKLLWHFMDTRAACWYKDNIILYYSYPYVASLDLSSGERTVIIEQKALVTEIEYRKNIDTIFFKSINSDSRFNGELYSMKSDGSNLRLLANVADFSEISISHDDSKIAYLLNETPEEYTGLFVYNLKPYLINSDGSSKKELPPKRVSSIKFSPKMDILAYDNVVGPIWMINLDELGKKRKIANRASPFCWSHNGDKIAYVGYVNKSGVHVIDIITREDKMIEETSGTGKEIEWSVCGSKLLYVTQNDYYPKSENLFLLDLQTHEKKKIITGEGIWNLKFKPK